MKTTFPQKIPKYKCEYCDITTNNKKDYDKHIMTSKHKIKSVVNTLLTKSPNISQTQQNDFICDLCGKNYKSRVGLWKHKKVCILENKSQSTNVANKTTNKVNQPTNVVTNCIITTDIVLELIKDNKEMKQIILEQNNTINNLVKNGITNNNNTNNNIITNSNNKTFNLQFFLNETCKDAMNITDFVDSLNLELSDLEDVGKVGYIEGISNIIIKNLKSMDETKRPVHCTDKKRETIYIKDQGQWEKEDDNKTKLKKTIKKVANKNIRLINQFREKYPECRKSESSISDKYNKMIIEAMGGPGDNTAEKEEKIIRNIAKNVAIEK
jgi:hypothetical protein